MSNMNMKSAESVIEVIGAKQNNLKNISVNIPQDKLTVITGVSGSGKSSLAFDVIYGEAQRRFLKSVSNFAKGRINQLKKPNVDYIRGLSPVIAIEQKKGNHNPRSTVGTVTDINDYLRLLLATAGTGKCPVCEHVLKPIPAGEIAEHILNLPQGMSVELYTRTHKVYGEDYPFLFEKIRKKGYKHLLVDGTAYDLSETPFELDEGREYHIEILIDRIIVKKEMYLPIIKAIESAISVLDDELSIRIDFADYDKKQLNIGCPDHHYVLCELQPFHFSFNIPSSACTTCSGVGTSYVAEPRFMVLHPKKSIMKGALHPALYNHRSHTARTVIVYSLAAHYGFNLDTPFEEYSERVRDILYNGSRGEVITMIQPPFVEKHNWATGRSFPVRGFIQELESWYRITSTMQEMGIPMSQTTPKS